MRQPTEYIDERYICLAFCEENDVTQVCEDLSKLDRSQYYIIILIKDAWQLTIRKLIKRCPSL